MTRTDSVPDPAPPSDAVAKVVVRLSVNGAMHEVAVRPADVLLDTLRDDLGLTGTTRGCDMGACGCCTVLIDGAPMLACLTLTALTEGREILTIEGVAPPGVDLHPLQSALHEHGGSQCGYCTPGFIMTALAFLKEHPDPTTDEIRRAISGNMCRCTGYVKIIEAIAAAAKDLSDPAPTGGESS
ncbi:MAG: (2Fe-2S)-binding protein [Gemmatimonadota bacterium]|jgi:carbon-monoxide dehydrogenase small subunit|nr:(2Fe-2S)-binding protein [Gemmatimonadota bacterium]MDP6528677.1 (2Fe-2S)-binding protein [Gemmatimonadota bacterium]MDP6803658.1 (2Fe-2S)-binding protein [Gemmatimonadota bacterium]MDP7031696.1 (2Fe-2S)-binding protein [Gemmatimonadota bacterium]